MLPNFRKGTFSCKIILIKRLPLITCYNIILYRKSMNFKIIFSFRLLAKMVEWQAIEGEHLNKIILWENVAFQNIGHILQAFYYFHSHNYCKICCNTWIISCNHDSRKDDFLSNFSASLSNFSCLNKNHANIIIISKQFYSKISLLDVLIIEG